METRGHKQGQKVGPYSLRYFPKCICCGREFPAARPEAKTCDNRCRSGLRAFKRFYGYAPDQPFMRVRSPEDAARDKWAFTRKKKGKAQK